MGALMLWKRSSRKQDLTSTVSSWMKGLDKIMSAWRPHASKNSGLPSISCIQRKIDLLSIQLKTVCCPASGVMFQLEIQRDDYIVFFSNYQFYVVLTLIFQFQYNRQRRVEEPEIPERDGGNCCMHNSFWRKNGYGE